MYCGYCGVKLQFEGQVCEKCGAITRVDNDPIGNNIIKELHARIEKVRAKQHELHNYEIGLQMK